MKRNRIETSLYRAVNSAPTIPFEELAAAPFIKMSEHDYITKQENRHLNAQIRQFSLAAALCLILLVPLTGWFYQNKVTDSVITMDVNPSIKITTNRKDHVLNVIALNEDAGKMLGDNDYNGRTLDEVVADLLDNMVEQSYLSTDKNTILLTVMNKNKKKADELLTTMDIGIRDHLKARSITPTILKQIISKETDRSGLAREYNISEGKMKLIQDLLSQNDSFTIDMLAGMSMEQLYRLARENAIDLSGYLSYEDTNTDISNEDTGSDQEESEDLENEDTQKNDDLEENDSEDGNQQGEDQNNQDNENQNQDNEDQNQDDEDQNQDNEDQNRDSEDQNQDSENQNQDSEDQNQDSEDQNQDYEDQNQVSEDQNQDSEVHNDENEDNISEGDQGSSIEDQEESSFEDAGDDSSIDENQQDSTLEENNDSEENNNQDEGNTSSEGSQESDSASEDE